MTPIERLDWTDGPPVPDTEPVETPAVVPQAADDIDDEDIDQKLIDSGAFTAEQLAKHYGRPVEDIAPKPQTPSRMAIESALAEIAGIRRADRRGYFKNEALQERERELIALRDQLQAEPEAVESDEGAAREILDPALIEEWEDGGGVAFHLAQLQTTAQAVVDGVDPDAREAFTEGFDALPASAQTEVYRFLAVEPSGAARPANAAGLEDFATTEEGAALAAEWGDAAAAKLGMVRARMGGILNSMSDGDRSATVEWFDALPAAQAMAVLRALAGR